MSNVKIQPLVKQHATVSVSGVRIKQVNVPGTRGPKGDTGEGIHVLDVYASYDEFIADHPRGAAGHVYMVRKDFYIWSDHLKEWANCGPLGVVTGPMTPDPRAYFLHILNGGAPDEAPSDPGYPDVPDEPDTPEPDVPDQPDVPVTPTDNAYSPKLNTGKLNYMVLA